MGPSAPVKGPASAQFIVLFDGVCNLCNRAVQFIIKRDPKGKFHFAALQSKFGERILAGNSISQPELFSILLWENGTIYDRSTAVLKITKELSGAWPLLYGFILIPAFIRNFFYRLVASSRYKIFGRKDQCMVPTAEQKARFLE